MPGLFTSERGCVQVSCGRMDISQLPAPGKCSSVRTGSTVARQGAGLNLSSTNDSWPTVTFKKSSSEAVEASSMCDIEEAKRR